jgi:DNA polymerase-1
LLYVDLNLPIQYKRRKTRFEPKRVTTDAEALNKLSRATSNPVLSRILELKKMYKLMTFLDVELSPDNKVHTCYNVTGATMSNVKASEAFVSEVDDSYKSFARWSSSASIILPYGSGNLQNQPKDARAMMVAPEGKLILQADYMQAEAVVVAYVINDQSLIHMFKESFGMRKSVAAEKGFDVHKITASQMFGVSLKEVTGDLRTIGKRIRHATNYSAGPGVLANSLGIKLTEAKRLLELYHDTCPQLRIWQGQIQKHLQSSRVLENLFGRQHLFMGRWDDSLFRSAYSYIPQSTVGDMLNYALVRLYNTYGSDIHIYIQLHDAVYTLIDEDKVAESIAKMRECMIMPLQYKGVEFTIDVDFSVGKSWGKMADLEWQDYVTPENEVL